MIRDSTTLGMQSETSPLYRQVAQQVTRLIEEGTLRPGERIPSVRKFRKHHQVSITTVTQAYRLLESQGLIEARPQSGYYVRARRWLPPPEPEMTKPEPRAKESAWMPWNPGSMVAESRLASSR